MRLEGSGSHRTTPRSRENSPSRPAMERMVRVPLDREAQRRRLGVERGAVVEPHVGPQGAGPDRQFGVRASTSRRATGSRTCPPGRRRTGLRMTWAQTSAAIGIDLVGAVQAGRFVRGQPDELAAVARRHRREPTPGGAGRRAGAFDVGAEGRRRAGRARAGSSGRGRGSRRWPSCRRRCARPAFAVARPAARALPMSANGSPNSLEAPGPKRGSRNAVMSG